MRRCPVCNHILYRLTMTHPWRLFCPICKREVQEAKNGSQTKRMEVMMLDKIKTKGIPVKMEDGRVVEFCELADATDVILDIADFPELKGEGDDNN